MNRYQIILSSDLDAACCAVADDLNMSVEQVLSSAVQLYMEHLTLEFYEGFANVEPLRGYQERYQSSENERT